MNNIPITGKTHSNLINNAGKYTGCHDTGRSTNSNNIIKPHGTSTVVESILAVQRRNAVPVRYIEK